jgi:hypothetical protein
MCKQHQNDQIYVWSFSYIHIQQSHPIVQADCVIVAPLMQYALFTLLPAGQQIIKLLYIQSRRAKRGITPLHPTGSGYTLYTLIQFASFPISACADPGKVAYL